MSDLSLIFSFVLDQLSVIFNLYTGCFVLTLSLSVWVLDRLFHIFDIFKR